MPGYIDVQIVGDTSGVQAMLMHLHNKLSPGNMASFLLGNVDPFLRTRASARFSGEGDDVVGSWAPLQPATQAIRVNKGYGADHPINRRTGELERYITGTMGSVAVTPLGSVLTSPGTPPSGELADKVSTAQSGRAFPRTVPRPVLGVNERDLAAVLTMLALDIQKP
jgi:hypothetical protein